MPKLVDNMIEYIENRKLEAFYQNTAFPALAGKRIQKPGAS
jgi:hypothetical protein